MYSINGTLQQSFAVAKKRAVTRCEKSSQNMRCLKTSTSHTRSREEILVDNHIINLTVEENI